MNKLIALFLCILLLPFPYAAHAEPALDAEQRVEELTNEILHKEIDLERFYLNYRVIGTEDPKFRRLRYFLLQTASAACTLSSNITDIHLSRQAIKSGGKTDFGEGDAMESSQDSGERTARNSLVVGMVGTILDGGSSAVELCSNGFTAVKNIRRHQNPSSAVKAVVARVKEIDALMTERKALIESNPVLKGSMHAAEGKVLTAFRNWSLAEFADVYAEVKSTQSSYNIYYVLDIVSDVFYVSSYILSIKALNPNKSNLGGAAVNVGIVGDSFGIVSAPASTIGGTKLYNYWRKKLKTKLQEELQGTEEDAKAAMAELQTAVASTDYSKMKATSSVQTRLATYGLWAVRYDDNINKQLDELRRQNKVALQDEISGPAISGTYLVQDILAGVAFHRYGDKPVRAAKLALAGSTTAAGGTSVSLALTNWYFFNELYNRRKLRKKNALPEQLMADRLATLDELDAMLIKAANR